MSTNPFAAPEAELGAPPPPPAEHHGDASIGQRMGNLLIDYVAAALVYTIMGALIGAFFGAAAVEGPAFQVGGLFYMVPYYFVLEGLAGRTVGKLVTGTKVIDEDTGRRPSLWRILGRTLVRFVPFEMFSFLGGDARGWHDTWSHTRVVRLRPSKVELAAQDL